MRQKLNLIAFGVENLEKSLNFYEKGLGWKKSDKTTGDLALFALGGISLALYPRQELAKDAGLQYEPSAFSGLTLCYNAKSEKEVEEVLAEVEKLGATIIKPPKKAFWEGYSGYFKDPDDQLIEVAFNPFW